MDAGLGRVMGEQQFSAAPMGEWLHIQQTNMFLSLLDPVKYVIGNSMLVLAVVL